IECRPISSSSSPITSDASLSSHEYLFARASNLYILHLSITQVLVLSGWRKVEPLEVVVIRVSSIWIVVASTYFRSVFDKSCARLLRPVWLHIGQCMNTAFAVGPVLKEISSFPSIVFP